MGRLRVFLLLALVSYVLSVGVIGCTPSSYKLSTSANPSAGGSVTPAGGIYQKGVAVNVTAASNPGYRFDHWEGGASGTSPTVQVVMDSNRNPVAYFTKVYTLFATASPSGGGTLTLVPPGGIYDAGKQVDVIAAPAKYYRFSGWAGDASGNSDHLAVTMDSNKAVVASFVKIMYTIQTQVDAPNSGTVAPNGGAFEAGTPIAFTATAAPEYRFDQWAGDVSGKTNPTSVVVERDMKVTASFVRVYTLTVSASPSDGGTVTPKSGLYDAGTKVPLSATPLFPYYFKNWTGADDNSVNPTTVTMKGDTSVTAIFERLVARPQQNSTRAVSNDALGRWGPVASIPIQLNKFEWVQGEIIWQTPNTPNTPVQADIKDLAGNMVKDFGSTRQANFVFMAQTTGRYTIVFQNNSTWYADYKLTYTVWGKPQ